MVKADGLEPSKMGGTWGVTVFPSRSKTALRLNVGRRHCFTINAPGTATLYLVRDLGPSVRLPESARRTDGIRALPESVSLTVDLSDAHWLLAIPEVMQLHRTLVEDSFTKRLQTNWHNPLAGELLYGEA